MKTMRMLVFGVMVSIALVAVVGCSGSGSSRRDKCKDPKVSECLNSAVTEQCREKNDDFDDICAETLQAENESPSDSSLQLTKALVPELDGAKFRDREIKDVVHSDQPPQYVDDSDTLPTYSFRGGPEHASQHQ